MRGLLVKYISYADGDVKGLHALQWLCQKS